MTVSDVVKRLRHRRPIVPIAGQHPYPPTVPLDFHLEWACVHTLVRVSGPDTLTTLGFAIECRPCGGWVGPGAGSSVE